jgi:flagellar biosynthesis protein FlhF
MTHNPPLSVRTLAIAAPSILKALRLMREQLGQEAIIVSSSMTAAGVEVVASLEIPADRTALNVAPPVLSEQPSTMLPVPCASLPVAVDARSGDTSVLREIHSMRGMIEEQLAGLAWNKTQRRDPLRGQLMRTLLGAGFSARLARDLLANLPAGLNHASGLDYLKSAMANQMPVLEDEDALMIEGGVYALMGPTGVGKTTTTAKLAARCVLRFGAAKLALITTDSYRIGAYEQLRIYGQILGVAVHAVKDVGDLETVLASLQDKHMVLIDTVGMSQRDRAVSDQIAMLCGVSRPVKRLLLLNAASHGDTLNEVVQAYRQAAPAHDSIGLAGCILTKVDEATHPGAVIDIVIRHQLPVHYVSSGQKVPEHLMLGDRKSLIDSAFEARSQSSMFIAGEADLEESSANRGDNAKVVAAEAVSERLRLQCQQLINTLAHNAKELTSSATALSDADIGFDQTRELWRQLSAPSMDEEHFLKAMLSRAKADSQTTCKDYALAVTSLSSPELPLIQGQSRRITALLSDCTGLPFAAIPLRPTDSSNPGPKQSCDTWLDGTDNKPLVYLLDSQSTAEQIQDWQFAGLRWVVSAPASLQVECVPDSPLATLAHLASALVFSPAGTVVFKGRKACLSVAEARVRLRAGSRTSGAVKETTVRFVVRRIADANGHQIGQGYLLASPNILASPGQLVQWSGWRGDCVPYFTLLKQAVQQLEATQVPHQETGLVKVLVAGQIAITVFGLQQAQQGWSETARRVMAQLAGQALWADRPVPGRALLEGLGKLCVLLDALESGEAASRPPMPSKQLTADGNMGSELWTS